MRTLLLITVLATLFGFMVCEIRADGPQQDTGLNIVVVTEEKCRSTMEDHIQAHFTIFSNAVVKAAKDMDVEPVMIRLIRSMRLENTPTKSLVSGWVGTDNITDQTVRGIDITQAFLVNPPVVLRHVAYHEVCHLRLEADGNPNYGAELLAEACVFKYEGEEAFMQAYKILYWQLGYPTPTVEAVKKALGIER